MNAFEHLVGKAMLASNDEDRNLAMAQYTCKLAASRLMFCPVCQNILDQKTAVVLEYHNSTTTLCTDCAPESLTDIVQRTADKTGATITINRWDTGMTEVTPR